MAQELAKFQGEVFYFNGLTTIDVGVAQELAKFKGKGVGFNGLTTIDVGVVQELAKFQGEVFIFRWPDHNRCRCCSGVGKVSR